MTKTHSEDHVYKVLKLAGSSADSVEDAIDNAIERASASVKKMRWFEVEETRGKIDGGEVAEYQVVLSVGFTLEE